MLDLIIVGTGPAGVAASIYASRYKIEHKIFGLIDGGLISTSSLVDNYPGFMEVSGFELGDKFMKHVAKFNPDGIVRREIKEIIPQKDGTYKVIDAKGEEYESKTILLAAGTKYRRLGIPGEDEFEGKGVTWCATCDAFFYKNKTVAVVGGGDSALEAAHLLGGIAKKVYLVHRGATFRAEPTWVDMVQAMPNVECVMERSLTSIDGKDGAVATVHLDKPYGGSDVMEVDGVMKEKNVLGTDGVFIEIGSDPIVNLPNQLSLDLDEQNYVVVGPDQKTTRTGVFAAGDFTTGSNKFRQVLPAMAEGVIAVSGIYNYLHNE